MLFFLYCSLYRIIKIQEGLDCKTDQFLEEKKKRHEIVAKDVGKRKLVEDTVGELYEQIDELHLEINPEKKAQLLSSLCFEGMLVSIVTFEFFIREVELLVLSATMAVFTFSSCLQFLYQYWYLQDGDGDDHDFDIGGNVNSVLGRWVVPSN